MRVTQLYQLIQVDQLGRRAVAPLASNWTTPVDFDQVSFGLDTCIGRIITGDVLAREAIRVTRNMKQTRTMYVAQNQFTSIRLYYGHLIH